MKKVNLQEVEMNKDMETIKRELKRIASIKSRLKKQCGRSSYESDMKVTIEYEDELKSVRARIGDETKSVPQYTWDDVQVLSYDETIRALKSIQSKKSLTKWLTPIEGDNDEYRSACRVEQMLRDHKETLQPSGNGTVSKVIVEDIITLLENNKDTSIESVISLLRNLL